MSVVLPTPSPRANAASLITWQTILPSTSPGASCTQVVCLPIVAKKRSAASAAPGGRFWVRRPVLPVSVDVVAAPRLAAQAARRHGTDGDGGGAPAGLAEALLIERLRDLQADIDADEVHQLEWPHPKASAQA